MTLFRQIRGRLAPQGALQLVAQHHEFEVLVAFCPSEGSQYLKSAARDEVAETEGHDRRWLTTPKKASPRADRPFGALHLASTLGKGLAQDSGTRSSSA